VPPGGYGPPPGQGHPGGGYPPGPGGYPGPSGGARNAFSPGDAVTFAWERIKADPGTILATVIVGAILMWVVGIVTSFMASVVGGIGSAASRHVGSPFDTWSPLLVATKGLGSIVSFVVSAFVLAGIMNFSLKVARGAPYTFADLFSGAPFFVSVLVANLVVTIGAGIGFALLIVPGVIVALGLSMAIPLIIDRNLGPVEALTESWKLTDGHKTNLFVFGLIAVGLIVGGVCACVVGVLLVLPLLYIAHMYIYLKLTGQPVAAIGRGA